MIEIQGNLLEADVPAIAQGVNCQGLMGAGIALPIRNRWPGLYQPYFERCENHELEPGFIQVYEVPEEEVGDSSIVLVYNVATQFRPGADATYPALFHGLTYAAWDLKNKGFDTLGVPLIGCGIGGLDWEYVKGYLQMIEKLTEITFKVYRYE